MFVSRIVVSLRVQGLEAWYSFFHVYSHFGVHVQILILNSRPLDTRKCKTKINIPIEFLQYLIITLTVNWILQKPLICL